MNPDNEPLDDLFADKISFGHQLLFRDDSPQHLPWTATADFALDPQPTSPPSPDAWKVMLVDDEADIHAVVRLALQGFNYRGRELAFVDAYDAQQAKILLAEHPDTAVLLLDVVMESQNAGLELVHYIRHQLCNDFLRIVLWTGQPGTAPERRVIDQYEINDYRTKTELTSDKLYTTVMASLRSFEAIQTIEHYRSQLEAKVLLRTQQLAAQNQVLERQTQQLQKLNVTREKFFRIISHDLKNPLAAILSLTESMDRGFEALDPDDLRQGLRRVHHSTHNLFGLLENLLQWAKAQDGVVPFAPRVLELASLIDSELALASEHALRKKLTTRVHLGHQASLVADENMVRTIVRNLYSNAIKFSYPCGSIEIGTRNDDTWFELYVADHGKGIDPHTLQTLLANQPTASTTGTAHEQGTGLGLLICRELLERHQGLLAAQSSPEDGTRFICRFPLPAKPSAV